jgi:HSP20 family protein
VSERAKRDPISEEFDQLLTDLWRAQFSGHHRGFRPAVDSYRSDDPPRLVVVVELPGIDPENVQIVLQERTLVIAGERIRRATKGRRYHQMEIDHGSFQRRIHLHEQVDAEAASASYERGLLTIVLPLSEREAGSVRVPIKLRSRS